MKRIYITLLLLYSLGIKAQDTHTSKGIKTIGIESSIGKNNFGGGILLGYYLAENFAFNVNFGIRKFELRDYAENITDVGLEAKYHIYSINDRYLRNASVFTGFNVAFSLGARTEFVDNTSNITLADPYPQLYYATGAVFVETSLYDNLKIAAHFRQWQAVSGDTSILGQHRYDFGLGLRFYF